MPKAHTVIAIFIYLWIAATALDALEVWLNIWPSFLNPGHLSVAQMAVNNAIVAAIVVGCWLWYRFAKSK